MRMHAGRTRTVVVVAIARIHLRPCARPASLEAISSEWHSARLTVAPFERNCLSRLTIAGLTKREGEDAQNQFWTLADGRAAGGGEGPPKRAHSQPSEEEEKRLGKTTRWGLLGSAVGRPVLEGLGSRKHWWIQTGAGQHPAPAASSNAGMTRATCVVLCCTSVLFLPFFQRHLSLPFSSDTRGPASPCSLGASQAVSFRRERSCPSLPPVTLARAGCVADLRSLCPCRP